MPLKKYVRTWIVALVVLIMRRSVWAKGLYPILNNYHNLTVRNYFKIDGLDIFLMRWGLIWKLNEVKLERLVD